MEHERIRGTSSGTNAESEPGNRPCSKQKYTNQFEVPLTFTLRLFKSGFLQALVKRAAIVFDGAAGQSQDPCSDNNVISARHRPQRIVGIFFLTFLLHHPTPLFEDSEFLSRTSCLPASVGHPRSDSITADGA
jgi:hypothetical protein